MLFTEFGKEATQSALRDYLNKTSYGTVRPTDLWNSFEPYVSITINKKDVRLEEVMDTWTNQPGYPVVHATLKNNQLSLYQVIKCSFLRYTYVAFDYINRIYCYTQFKNLIYYVIGTICILSRQNYSRILLDTS